MKHTIFIFTENRVGLLHRVMVIFTRRGINIESISASESEVKGVHRYTITVESSQEQVVKIVKQIEKQVEVIKAFHHVDKETVFQEIALYKMPIAALVGEMNIEQILREHHARILTIEHDFFVVEKTGHYEDTQALFEVLDQFDLLSFVRSGRIAIAKEMGNFSEQLELLEEEHKMSEISQSEINKQLSETKRKAKANYHH
ncbi:MAG: acetolactate synthase-1/3 small subunit [Bacteroidia bacterium]|jgi:acetolactate synthase-1/3 small subunit